MMYTSKKYKEMVSPRVLMENYSKDYNKKYLEMESPKVLMKNHRKDMDMYK